MQVRLVRKYGFADCDDDAGYADMTMSFARQPVLVLVTALVAGALWALAGAAAGVRAQEAGGELNLYSSRHYQTDQALYDDFTRQTGIRINRLEGKGDALIERIRSEGANSPADVLVTVDAGRLWRADQAGLFQPVRSAVLEARIPSYLRHPEGHWFGYSTRARMIFYNKELADPAGLARYEDLADPRWRGQICIRSSSNIYNLSLMASLIAHHGVAEAERWAEGVVANFARPPQGGDTDQLRAVAAGECAVGVANGYYFARLMLSDRPGDAAVVEKVAAVFPNQADRGTHVNVSGAGVLRNAPNRDNAIRFLEYLASDQAQRYFANGNNEYPVVQGLLDNPALAELGDFRTDTLNVSVYGENQPEAQRVYDRAGWQ